MTQHIPEIPEDPIEDVIERLTDPGPQPFEREIDVPSAKRQALAVIAIAFLLIVLAWCALYPLPADAQTPAFQSTTKGRIVLSCGGAEISQHVVETEATERVIRWAIDNGGKASCVMDYPSKTVVVNLPTASPLPACPAKPADDMQVATCPAGSTGTWTQTRAYSMAAAPTCWTAGEWTPRSPPAGACVVDLVAPTNLTATLVPDAPWNSVTLVWGAVGGATLYEVERCTLPLCKQFEALSTVAVLAYANTGLPGGPTWRYRVRAVDSTRKGPYSAHVDIHVPVYVPPPVAGTATISWTPPTTNSDGTPLTNLAGYRLWYRRFIDPEGADTMVAVNGPAVTSYVVTGLSSGTWVFRVTAVTASGAESLSSSSATRVVP